jgi:hypothetical protein
VVCLCTDSGVILLWRYAIVALTYTQSTTIEEKNTERAWRILLEDVMGYYWDECKGAP